MQTRPQIPTGISPARKLRWVRSIAQRGALLLYLAVIVAQPVAAEDLLQLTCRHDPSDEILVIICGRVEAEAPMVAGAFGYRVRLAAKEDRDASSLASSRSIDIALTASRPDSQFGTKRIDATLTGRFADADAGPWTAEMSAEGVARDLVHPVADALLGRVEAFLTTDPSE